MVAIQGISLDTCAAVPSEGALAFALNDAARTNRLYRFFGQTWEVEFRQGCSHAVARTTALMSRPALLNSGIDATHRALDLISIEGQEHLSIRSPASDHVLYARENGKAIVRFSGTSDFGISMAVSMELRRADGTIERQAPPPVPKWTSAFRFYRLAQSGQDLFDAYRNMFLALEALLDQLFPKTAREGEKVWLHRAIKGVGTKVDLTQILLSGAADLAGDIVNRLYGVRVQLFHAKTGRTLLPHGHAGYLDVAEAYPVLVHLCTEIIRQWLGSSQASGVVTHQGFRSMIESAYLTAAIAVTADDSPPQLSDEDVSPSGLPVAIFADLLLIAETALGRMTLEGRTAVADLPAHQSIGRAAILVEGKPTVIGNIVGRLALEGADIFEVAMTLRLVNRNLPRTEFS